LSQQFSDRRHQCRARAWLQFSAAVDLPHPLRSLGKGLLEEFGPECISDKPLSESAFLGTEIGAVTNGTRPIVEIMTVRVQPAGA